MELDDDPDTEPEAAADNAAVADADVGEVSDLEEAMV
jgi:hypothetical protein